MATLKELAGDVKPVVGYPKTIQFGPVTLDGFMLENGEFRQSITSTERALGAENSKIVNRMLVPRSKSSVPVLAAIAQNPFRAIDRSQDSGQNTESGQDQAPVIIPVRCPGIQGYSLSYTINLPLVSEAWMNVALGGGKYARQAQELLKLAMVHSLERVYQEAFHVQDVRSTNDRLVEWAVRMDVGKHFPMFGGRFHKEFARITGVAIGHNHARICLADLVYFRLPKSVYSTIKDLNPETERGWRQFTHSQLMTDDMRQYTREIVAGVTALMSITPSKQDDPRAFKKLINKLDDLWPRHNKRGHNPGVYPAHLKAMHEQKRQQKAQTNG